LNVLSRLSGALDVGVRKSIRLASLRGKPPVSRRDPGATLRWLATIARDYPTDAADFHLPVPVIAPIVAPVLAGRAPQRLPDGGRLLSLRWPSDAPPFGAGSRMRNDRFNRVAVARWHQHEPQGTPRPVVIVIHGYGAGQWALESKIWPLARLYADGFDVVQVQLPFHGERANPARRGMPGFPGADPRRNLEGFRQAMVDVRGLIQYFRRVGAPSVGLWGMSLGAYSSALTATLEPVDALVLTIPLASLVDYAADRALLATGGVGEAQAHLLRRIYAPIDPFAASQQVARDRVFTVVAAHDGITPIEHGHRLAERFGGEVYTWPGGHLWAPGRQPGWDAARAFTRKVMGG
jgi:pimeloyl-ACP methyl ester carboxylesterase